MSEQSGGPQLTSAQSARADDTSAVKDAKRDPERPRSEPESQRFRRVARTRTLVGGVCGVVILAMLLVFGIPWVKQMLNTVSTDDAYVNGHVTFVAPRVGGQIARVLVDDNNRVHKGDFSPNSTRNRYRSLSPRSRRPLIPRQADLRAATATARGDRSPGTEPPLELAARHQDVDNQVALLHARVAALDKSKAELALAQVDFYRAQQLVGEVRCAA